MHRRSYIVQSGGRRVSPVTLTRNPRLPATPHTALSLAMHLHTIITFIEITVTTGHTHTPKMQLLLLETDKRYTSW